VPCSVERLAAGRELRLVWQNAVGGLTFELSGPDGRLFVKWQPAGCDIDLEAEAQRLLWASRFTPVPAVVGQGSDSEGAWIITAALPGENAVSARWRKEPATAVRAIGEGLRALHDSLPVGPCPFSWSAEERIADARRRAAIGMIDPKQWWPEHREITVDEALALVEDAPPLDRVVVCHGDACAPNTLIGDNGLWSGHVDFGELGVADRWADLAIATWSTQWNYGPGWEPTLLGAYGVEPDPVRTGYYRLLWELGP